MTIIIPSNSGSRLIRRTWLTAGTCLLMSGIWGGAPAFAQDTPAPSDSAATAEADSDEIVITANRTESLLSRTPTAVTALTGAALTDAGITNPTELADHVPSVSIDRNNGLQLTIRGVSSTDNTEKGDPSAAFLLDGVYIARPQAQEVSFFDLDRVEVLRGPQGTLYGRNTTAGLINVIAARPRMEMAGSVDATVGNFNTYQVTGMVNVPVGASAALRAAVNFDRRDSYLIENPGSSFDIDPAKKNLSGRLSFLANLGESVEVLLRADYSSIKGSNRESVRTSNLFEFPFASPADGQRGVDPEYIGGSSKERRTLTYVDPVPTNTDNSTWGAMAEVNWSISDAFTLTYLGSYREFERDESFPLFIGGFPGFLLISPAIFTGDYWQNSQELRLAYDSDLFDIQVGAYYFKEKSGIELDLIGLNSPTPGTEGYVFGFPQVPTISKSLAFFGQGTFHVTDEFRITAGIRHTDDDKSRVGATINHHNLDEPLNFVPDPITNPVADVLNKAAVAYKQVTWKAGLEYDISPTTLLYGSVSTGYKAGGFNDGCLVTDANCANPVTEGALFYDPEKLTAYELGLKTRFAGRGNVFVNFFHYDYTNLQLSAVANVCGGPCQVTTNAGKARVNGVEVEAAYRFDDRNRITGTAAWLDAEYTDYEVVPGVNFKGESLNRSPDWSFTLGYQHTVPLGNGGEITLDAFTRYSDEYYIISSPLRAQFRQPSFTKTDFNITYRSSGDRWYVGAFVKNIENKVTIGNASVGPAFPGLNDGETSLSAPRTYGARAGIKF